VSARGALVAVLRFYKRFISPMLPPACRFQPTCSEYAREAVEHYGVLKGSYMAACRLARCHPWSRGGFDPVPIESRKKDLPQT
jgi:putative membrane protein insertion efficiency factor